VPPAPPIEKTEEELQAWNAKLENIGNNFKSDAKSLEAQAERNVAKADKLCKGWRNFLP